MECGALRRISTVFKVEVSGFQEEVGNVELFEAPESGSIDDVGLKVVEKAAVVLHCAPPRTTIPYL